MAIVKMNKFNLYSFDSNREYLLKALQKFKYVHFNDLEKNENETEFLEEVEIPDELLKIDEDISKTTWAINLLRKFEEKKSSIQSLKEGNKSYTLLELTEKAENFDFEKYYNELYELSEKRISFEQEIQSLDAQIAELKPWEKIPVSLSELNNFKSTNISMGTIPSKYLNDFYEDIKDLELTEVIEVNRALKMTYLVVITSVDESDEIQEAMRKNGFSQSVLKADKLIKDKIVFLEEEKRFRNTKISEIDETILKNSDQLENFRIYYEYLRNTKLRYAASENFLKTEQVDLIEGYVPEDKKEEFLNLLKEILNNNYYIEINEADVDDPKVPIMLKNNKFSQAFESLTEMYSMPKYNEIDPTPLFAPFYCIFAGIMVGDLGYGLLLFFGTLFALKKFNLDETKRRFIKFFNYLGISTIMWGLIFGSFFGDIIPMKNLIDPSTDYIEMILMSLIFGGIHIFFALGIKAYMDIRDKKPLDALYDVGFWYMALVGVIVLIIDASMGVNPLVAKISKVIMILGMVGIVLTGGRKEESIAGKFGWGIYSLYGITSYFGDFVSYLRLMALALSGSFIAIAVNIIVRILMEKGIIGIIVGVLVFIIFQLFNMFLSYLSTYVHSARLIYVEMFNKFYEGGGIPFKKMIEKAKYFNIKEE